MSPNQIRGEIVAKRTYCRIKQDGRYETWEEVCARTIEHQKKLWEEAQGGSLAFEQLEELSELGILQVQKKSLLAGRTLWLGGTEYSTTRACCQFNCCYTPLQTVYDVVDAAWLLLNGCGVGHRCLAGTLHGYMKRLKLVTTPSTRHKDYRGSDTNTETVKDGVWTIKIGDSAESWARTLGKMINPKRECRGAHTLHLDFSELRGPGGRLKGYGWICNGYEPLCKALTATHNILNAKSGELLDEIDILDIINHFGTTLSNRRSAQISLLYYGHPLWRQFVQAKNSILTTDPHRQQSNNSIVFWQKPSIEEIRDLLEMIWENGGAEPGFVNGEAALIKAPWWDGFNPCAEILLSARGFCNLTETCLPAFKRDFNALLRALYIIARANYRQTCVNLRDGVLSPAWDQTNSALRLCGVGVCGVVQSEDLTDYQIRRMRDSAVMGACSMADELGLPRPKAVTTIKPGGTIPKVMGCTEGMTRPLGKYIFNWVQFSKSDPIVRKLTVAKYQVMDHPDKPEDVLICLPVEFSGTETLKEPESAIKQLERYKRWNKLYADHNVSNTISWDVAEIEEIASWLFVNWDDFIAVSWMKRNSPTKTASDHGFKYLPQEVVEKEKFEKYVRRLDPVEITESTSGLEEEVGCLQGNCPVR
jgi:adenosylcobalamin-dependent ribonucleoside-triphosphate reductase